MLCFPTRRATVCLSPYATLTIAVVLAFAGTASAVETIDVPAPQRRLTAGSNLALKFQSPKSRSLALAITFADADFQGATVLPRFNGRRLLPYHAFGGDTRYDSVRGKSGMHPPLAKIEANYVLVADWVKAGENLLEITAAGPGSATIASVTVRDVSGHDAPKYENPIYFDFDVWRQGYAVRPGIHKYLDPMLLGIIPGGGANVMNISGPTLPVKLEAESARNGWGFGRSTFYSIWYLVMEAKSWAEFINIDSQELDGEKLDTEETQLKEEDENKRDQENDKKKKDEQKPLAIGGQYAYTPLVPPGTDISFIKQGGYLGVLKPAIDDLAAYATDYNLTCEQGGASTQGFGRPWGDRWAQKGYPVEKWANNYQTEFGRVTAYAHERNPEVWVCAPHWWTPSVRVTLYDTAKARGHRMGDMIDSFMTHYYSFPFFNYGPDGKPFIESAKRPNRLAHPELQYPGGKFELTRRSRAQVYNSTRVLIPEIVIDWNRYRLSRTEKDMKLADPKTHRWQDGKPFNFDAGFSGDERAYNNETCVYDRNYSAPAPYQFLYTMFTYSLLPTSAREPSELKITRTLPLLPDDPPGEDIFSEVDQPINRYGDWVAGAAGTHRLKTRDPLYGDLFGYTGFEQGNTGDYIWLGGIKDRHHRRAPHDSWNLVRRMCYAFVTAAPVYPATVNNDEAKDLFIKVLQVKQDGQNVIGVYAVNFTGEPHKLDLTLPAPWSGPAEVQAFTEKAGDWADAKSAHLVPQDGSIHITTKVPPLAPRCMFIYPPAGEISRALADVTVPEALGPWGNINVAKAPELRWRASHAKQGGSVAKYVAQVGREMLFRPQDIVGEQTVTETKCAFASALQPNWRYHWRVRALDGQGNSSAWSRPQSFWYQAGAGAAPASPTGDAPPEKVVVPRPEGPVELKPFTDPDNLALRGVYFAQPNFWEGQGDAVDGIASSTWLPDDGEERKPKLPAWWAVRFDGDEAVSTATLLWGDGKAAADFDVQTWDGKAWQTAKSVRGNKSDRTTIAFDKPVTTRAVRIWITAGTGGTFALAEVYLH